MTPLIQIRPAGPADVPSLVLFNQTMARETEGHELAPDTLTAGVRAVVENPRLGFYLVAECAGQVAGALMVTQEWSDWRNGNFWWVQSVYVLPEFRRRGIYRALYEEVKTRAARAAPAVCGFRLYVERDNQRAIETYTRLGMTETHYRMFEELVAKRTV